MNDGGCAAAAWDAITDSRANVGDPLTVCKQMPAASDGQREQMGTERVPALFGGIGIYSNRPSPHLVRRCRATTCARATAVEVEWPSAALLPLTFWYIS